MNNNIYCIDLGTCNMKIFCKSIGKILNEKNTIAIVNKNQIYAYGDAAYAMYEKAPESIHVTFPITNGVIADFNHVQNMIFDFLETRTKGKVHGAEFIAAVPTDITEVEKKAVIDAATQAGARKVYLIEEPIAAAIGAGIDISKACGNMVVDIGGGTTDVAVIALGGSVVNTSLKVAGDKFDEAVVKYIKRTHNVIIGERTAEDLKINIGCVFPKIQDVEMDIRGRDLSSGLPKTITIRSSEMLEALIEPAMAVVDAVHSVLERTPPELIADISDKGIYMTGGGALVDGLDKLIQEKTGINVMIANDTVSCVAIGTGKALDDLDTLDNVKKKK